MNQIGEYIFSVTGAALVSAIVLRLLDGKGSAAAIGKLLTGMFMVLTVFGPISQVRLSDVTGLVPELSLDANAAVEEGQAAAKTALAESISDRLEAYILDKAAQLGVTITVQVELSDDTIPKPQRVRLQGAVSPYAKQRLQAMLRDDLGLDKENQIWT